MNRTIPKILLAVLLLTVSTFAHEGHDTPGALPEALHRGKVKEATVKGEKKTPSEFFFEVVYENQKLAIYPLVLTSDNSSFAPAPTSEVGRVEARVKFIKGEKKLALKTGLNGGWNVFEAPFDSKGLNWFDVFVSATHKGQSKEAKIHFEFN